MLMKLTPDVKIDGSQKTTQFCIPLAPTNIIVYLAQQSMKKQLFATSNYQVSIV